MNERTIPTYRYARVTRQLPCVICGHDHWCLISRTGDRAVCCRIESAEPAPHYDGWYHEIPIRDRQLPATIKRCTRVPHAHAVMDFSDALVVYERAFTPAARHHAADTLGLKVEVFAPYRIGYHAESDALALPAMQLDDPAICGIRFRSLKPTGRKWWTAPGSTGCLLLPTRAPRDGEPVLLTEGPSDALAATQIGLHALARWSCALDQRQLNSVDAYLKQLPDPVVLVVGDNDERGTGQRGADGAAAAICQRVAGARVKRVNPPGSIKDLREWVKTGATAKDVIAAAKEVARGE